jgi:hypothetical protein
MTTNTIGFLVATLAVLTVGTGCRSNPASVSPEAQKPMSSDQLAQLVGPGKEEVALLALGADLNEEVVRDILIEYLKKHEYLYAVFANGADASKDSARLFLDPEATGRIAETVRALAAKHGLPAAQVATLILDYRVWHACGDRLRQNEL